MKIFYIAFFCITFCFSQKDKTITVFEYQVNYNLGAALEKKGYVFNYKGNIHYNTTKSVFLNEIKKMTVDEVTGIPNINIMGAGDGTENCLSDIDNSIILKDYSIGNQIVCTTETFIKQNWKTTGKNKIINKIDCIELTTKFRGRNYIAYVDLKRPINYGPWKFNNFPGLPILIMDVDNKLKWTLTEIKQQSIQSIEKFVVEQKDYLMSLKQMSLLEYVDLYDKTGDGHTLIVSKMSREYERDKSINNFKRSGLELKFEWEK